ncbi:hypothetical protein SEA_NICOLE72_42 [Microbacterium phage Nicole72]|uniref:Uncharacterized protein n=1 Tax=Microbacterium phage Nicole72 TaxID=3062838 RepID=A0ACD4UHR6_9CAUD|nr:hypothetical protein SEA_NICOLE72_42 [Microbacterium phage Nicole72]
MSTTTFRTEDEAIAHEMSIYSFTGPHTHREFPRGEDGEFTRETHLVTARWGGTYEDFVTIDVPCSGCWL